MSKTNIGKYITIEGIDGIGKTTSIKNFQKLWNNDDIQIKKLKQKFNNLYITQEPGGSDFGLQIRNLLLKNHFHPKLDYLTQAYLFATNRAYNYQNVILPHLQKNDLVISDRGIFSSLVYQSLDLLDISNIESNDSIQKILERYQKIIKINKIAMQEQINDQIIYFKCSNQTIQKRINQRKTADNNDKKIQKQDYLKRLHASYDLAATYIEKTANNTITKKFNNIDANQEKKDRLKELIKAIQKEV